VVRLLGHAELFAYWKYGSSLDGNRIICWCDSIDLVFQVVLKEIEKRELFMKLFRSLLVLFLGAIGMIVPNFVQACAVCFGDPSSPLTLGAKAGVLFMIGVLGVVLGGILAAIIYFVHRSRIVEVQSILHGENHSASN
jgi:hypothetical protein